MRNKKIIWIDIGTHFAQEYNSIFGTNISFFMNVCKRLIGGNILGRGEPISIFSIKDILYSRFNIRKRAKDFYTIFVEANHNIARKKNFYDYADLFFNLALTGNNIKSTSIIKLFLGDGKTYSQGSSIFSNKHNINQNIYIPTLGISSNDFFRALEMHLGDKFSDYFVILRLNCEGVEDSVIYSAHNFFGDKLKLICGSLKDVKEIKGIDDMNKLEDYMDDHKIKFVQFSLHINTWSKSHKEILKLIEKPS